MRKKRQSSQQCRLGSTSIKAVRKKLVKLTPTVNFINILPTAFTHADPECAKKDSQVSSVSWRFWELRAYKLYIEQ